MPSPSRWTLVATIIVLFVYGSARSMQFTTLATLAYADVGDAQKGAASTLWSVAQQMAIAMGIAFGARASFNSTAPYCSRSSPLMRSA